MITNSIEIDRSPEEVFAYLDQLDRHGEWQEHILSTKVETDPPTRVGSRAVDRRKVGGNERDIGYEVTEHDPPRRIAFRGLDGPVRVDGAVTVTPLDDGKRSRVQLDMDMKGHGLGVLFAPIARRQAAKQIPLDQRSLKEKLESGA